MPMMEVSSTMRILGIVVSIINIAGELTKIYGIRNAAIASFEACTPVRNALPPAIAEPAYAASATGGVTSATMPK